MKGWTPESRGIFTDDLNRARRQLVSAFEQKSSRLTPCGGRYRHLRRTVAVQHFVRVCGKIRSARTKTNWIFSDMMNETTNFQMPSLLPTGPQQMRERAKANRLNCPYGWIQNLFGEARPNPEHRAKAQGEYYNLTFPAIVDAVCFQNGKFQCDVNHIQPLGLWLAYAHYEVCLGKGRSDPAGKTHAAGQAPGAVLCSHLALHIFCVVFMPVAW